MDHLAGKSIVDEMSNFRWGKCIASVTELIKVLYVAKQIKAEEFDIWCQALPRICVNLYSLSEI